MRDQESVSYTLMTRFFSSLSRMGHTSETLVALLPFNSEKLYPLTERNLEEAFVMYYKIELISCDNNKHYRSFIPFSPIYFNHFES